MLIFFRNSGNVEVMEEVEMIAARHNGCGGIAFYFYELPQPGDSITFDDVVLVDGSHPMADDRFLCGSCGGPVGLGPQWLTLEEVEE